MAGQLESTAGSLRRSQACDMHMSIPASRWCVTYGDLNFLRREVLQAVKEGKIQAPANGLDDFDPLDKTYGPSIYTVNETYIIPVTRDAGMMSWALMRHPSGLDCEVFISHAWQEGIYEFLTKVQQSWRRGLQNLWCCMLANPQNLDISTLLRSPAESPFALALRAAQLVLVVPNRHRSVYTRLWCGYEAFLAQEEGKRILIAKNPNVPGLRPAAMRMALAGLLGVFIGLLVDFSYFPWPRQIALAAALAAFVGLWIKHRVVRIFLNVLAELVCCVEATRHFSSEAESAESPWSDLTTLPLWIHETMHHLFWLMAASFFCLLELDRLRGESTVCEAQQLRQGYKGSIAHAECARLTDAVKIHQEIDDQQDAVDYAIHVLLTAGMSTPALRYISRAGVDIEYAAYAEITAAAVLLIPFELGSLTNCILYLLYFGGSWYIAVLQGIAILCRLILLVIICRREADEQCFVLKLLTKFAGMLMILAVFAVLLAWWCPFCGNLTWLVVSDTGLLCLIPVALLGIQGTAERLPFGLGLLQLSFARGISCDLL